MDTVLKRVLAAFSVAAVGAVFLPATASASVCNPAKALSLLRQGQQQSVDGDKAKAVVTQFQAAREAWTCYADESQKNSLRGTMGKASADILVGAAQDAGTIGNDKAAYTMAQLALAEYRALAKDHSIPLEIRVYADSAVQAATSP